MGSTGSDKQWVRAKERVREGGRERGREVVPGRGHTHNMKSLSVVANS